MPRLVEKICAVDIVDGPNAILWMRKVIERLSAIPADSFVHRAVSVAGVNLELLADNAAMITDYCNIFYQQANSEPPTARIYVLTEPTALSLVLPDIDQNLCSPESFQSLANAAGLRAAYPFQKQTWKFFDIEKNIGVQVTASRETLPLWDATAPLRHHLHWILDSRSDRLAHAATLGHDGEGVVLFGAGGAGKSGTTLAGLSVGLKTVGDDYVALGVSDACVARSLYSVVKQDRSGLARHSKLVEQTAHIKENWRGKVMFDPTDFYQEPFTDKLKLGAVVLPQIVFADTPALRPATGREAMLSLMTSNLHQFPAEPETGMAFYGRLLRRVPCFHLDLSEDAQKNGVLLKNFIVGGFSESGLNYKNTMLAST